ncbi:MAG TPA: formate dehydrogenase accessory sulfurtransferase FdhD [Candidatus Deferrimicrobiaceae bacterium]|jgi:FdhD protein
MTVVTFDGHGWATGDHRPVGEFPISLTVNGVALATLIGSPHDPVFLVAGFLRTQGLVATADDLLSLAVCPDSGSANVHIRGEVSGGFRTVLTSGCGGGISFHLGLPDRHGEHRSPANVSFSPEQLFALMDGLAQRAERYSRHGGIHSAAVGDGRAILLFAEDLGRHNTIDRIAGEALLTGTDLSGKMLVTSGRVSSEMAGKAAMLGISLIASRTSPTDMAVRMCEELGITLAGYVRGGRFNVYAHPERITLHENGRKIPGVTAVILAGGASRRMGSDKALLPWQGGRLIEAVHRGLANLFEEVIVAGGDRERFAFLPCAHVPDLRPGLGPLSGIHAALSQSRHPRIFVVGCDMPTIRETLVRRLASVACEADAVVPESDRGLEPLHALYGKGALAELESFLGRGDGRIVSFLDRVKVYCVARDEVARLDPAFRSFRNVNTPEEYARLAEEEKG